MDATPAGPAIRSILVVLDRRRDPRRVLEKAGALARRCGARLELFLCDAESAYALSHAYTSHGVQQARDACIAGGSAWLESIRPVCGGDDLQVSVHVRCESPLFEGIVHRVHEVMPDLVIKEVGGGHDKEGVSLDANDWQLARTCPVPLLLTRVRPWREPLGVAVALDLSPDEAPGFAESMVLLADRLANQCGGQVHLLYSGQPAQPALDPTASGRVQMLRGEAGATLPPLVDRRGYDVLVLGALTHRRNVTPLLGTLTGSLLESCNCDFLLVKPPGYQSPVGIPAIS